MYHLCGKVGHVFGAVGVKGGLNLGQFAGTVRLRDGDERAEVNEHGLPGTARLGGGLGGTRTGRVAKALAGGGVKHAAQNLTALSA